VSYLYFNNRCFGIYSTKQNSKLHKIYKLHGAIMKQVSFECGHQYY